MLKWCFHNAPRVNRLINEKEIALYGKDSDGVRQSTNSIFDIASRKFIEDSNGDFTLVFPERPTSASVFTVTELPALLAKGESSDFKVDGANIKELISTQNELGNNAVIDLVTTNSIAIYGASGLFTNTSFNPDNRYAPIHNPEHLNNWREIYSRVNELDSHIRIESIDGNDVPVMSDDFTLWTDNQSQHYDDFLAQSSASTNDLVKGNWDTLKETGLKVGETLLKGAGFIGALAASGVVAAEVAQATQAGDHELARQILKEFAIESVGSEAGFLLGGVLGGWIAAGFGLTGWGLVAVAGVSAFAGSYFGAEGALEFHKWMSDLSDAQKEEIIDRYADLLLGTDVTALSQTDYTGLTFNSIKNSITAIDDVTHNDIVNNALSSEAWRYALVKLNPFVVEGADYTKHNENGELDLYDHNTGAGSLSEKWIEMRSYFLSFNTNYFEDGETDGAFEPLPFFPTHFGGDIHFVDTMNGTQYELTLDGLDLWTDPTHEIFFGGDAPDTYNGGDAKDYLFGGKGNDTFNAGDEDDYLEGNSGNDHLTGGTGDDLLDGGIGDDTYYYNTGDGKDIIRDEVGNDRLRIDGQLITRITPIEEDGNVFEDEYVNTYVLTDTGTMIISVGNETTSGTITLDWFDKDTNNFGITIEGYETPELPETPEGIYTVGNGGFHTDPGYVFNNWEQREASDHQSFINLNGLVVDMPSFGEGIDVDFYYHSYDSTSHHILYTNTEGEINYDIGFEGTNVKDILQGGFQGELLSGLAGDDEIRGYGGFDILRGGAGSDYIDGGTGNDVIWGNVGDKYGYYFLN